MQRCLHLALLGSGNVAPNPMVGAVLVHEDTIIGEGWHKQYGGPHAEVNCLASVKEEDRHLIPRSTLYVSLEPCAHFGKTPPCAELIIREKIPSVVIGCRDPFPLVNGKGIEKLIASGVQVRRSPLEADCRYLNRRFFTFQEKQRPYIVLKWAQTIEGFIAPKERGRLHISHAATNRVVHRWRTEEAAILVGTNTALLDDPELTSRLWPGQDPLRLVVDLSLRLPTTLKLFSGGPATIVFNHFRHEMASGKISREEGGLQYYRLERGRLIPEILNALKILDVQSVLVEGGAQLLQAFIDEGSWDEARVISGAVSSPGGLAAPVLNNARLMSETKILTDTLRCYQKDN